VASPIGCPENQKQTVRALGLYKLHQVVKKPGQRSRARNDPNRATSVESQRITDTTLAIVCPSRLEGKQ
jgi:hypothetical protein